MLNEISFSPHTPYVLILLLAFSFALNLKHVTPFETQRCD